MNTQNFFIILVVFALTLVSPGIVSADYYIKLGEIKGETEKARAEGAVGQKFVLDGSRSVDDGTVSAYSWRQVSGPYKFSTQSGNIISITPPTAGTYEFEFGGIIHKCPPNRNWSTTLEGMKRLKEKE